MPELIACSAPGWPVGFGGLSLVLNEYDVFVATFVDGFDRNVGSGLARTILRTTWYGNRIVIIACVVVSEVPRQDVCPKSFNIRFFGTPLEVSIERLETSLVRVLSYQ